MTEHGTKAIGGYAPRLIGYVIAVIAVALPITAGALAAVVLEPPATSTAVGVAVFLALTLLAELNPVPLDEDGARLVSLAFVFIVAAQILFGWEYGVLVSAVALVVAQVFARTPPLRTLFNAAAYVIAAFVAALLGVAIGFHAGTTAFGHLTVLSFGQGGIFVALNVLLVCGAIALHEGISVRHVVVDHLRHSGPAFVIMAFIAALAVALWTVEPPLLILLAGPVFALSLFQRYALRSRVATRAAETDSLTGLQNHRAYEADLTTTLAGAGGDPIGLCLLDIDNFKRLNDEFGHQMGDRMLMRLGAAVNDVAGVQAYRLGGDEFALITRGGEALVQQAVDGVRRAFAEEVLPDGTTATVSAGVASFPRHAATRDELTRAADAALYWSKRHGKNRLSVFDPAVVALSWSTEQADPMTHNARLRASESLIRVVDARDTYTGSHSQSVGVLVEAIARALHLGELDCERMRIAGLLHDLGKLAIPDNILQKPGRLEPAEFAILKTHSEHGYALLQGLGIEPVDRWILHHHEHWDGSGYPHGLAGEDIPIGSRIILVADAFDAITSDRVYRPAATVAEALAELRRCAGEQFDPMVVDALEHALGADAIPAFVTEEVA